MTTEEIKATYSIRDILARYGLPEPNRSGFIKCPFHQEDTASMKIYKRDYNCFGCGANGDIFTFVMQMDGLNFKEAFRELGGGYEQSFSARKRIYQAQKKREMERKREEKLRQKREQTSRLLTAYRKALALYEPLSEEWAIAMNELQYQEYLWEVLFDPDECWQVIEGKT